MSQFGKVLKQIREEKGFSQRQVAREIRMDFSYFSRLETGRVSRPRFGTIMAIKDALNATNAETIRLLSAAGLIGEEETCQ